MRALFLTPQLPYPPHQGAALRNYNLMRNLAGKHELHLLSFGDPAADLSDLMQLCAAVHVVPAPRRSRLSRAARVFLSPAADMALRLRSALFGARLAVLLREEQFDIIQAEGIEMAQYLALAPPKDRPALVFDDHNAEYVLQRRAFTTDVRDLRHWVGALYSLAQWQKLARYERAVCRMADATVAVSAADRQALLALDPALPVAVLPNGVDPDYFGACPRAPHGAPSLVFTGTMDFRPNVDAVTWLCRDILPRVARPEPEVKLYLVGQRPHRVVQALAGERVVVTGAVPDVRPYLASAAVYVVPMRMGGGVRFKVLEAMAAGVPVVSTPMGAEGIDVADGQEVALADGAEDFAARVLALLRDRRAADRQADLARTFVQRYDWRRLVPILDDLYGSLRPRGNRRG